MRKARSITAKFVQVLEYADGPQAILLERSEDVKIIAVAIEKNGFQYPFFGAEISFDQWERYRRGFVDLRFLFTHPRWREWYIFDFFGENTDAIPLHRAIKDGVAESDYVPEHGFFAYDHSEPIKEITSSSYGLQTYKTDGVWDLPDFAQFYGKITDLYSFSLCIKNYMSEATPFDVKRKIKESFTEQPLRGGSSYRNMYLDAHSILARDEDRIRVGKLYYGSPGEVDFRGRFDIFTEIRISFEEFRSHYEEVEQAYTELYEFLAKNKLLRAERDRFDVTGGLADYLLVKSRDFSATMRLSQFEIVYELSGRNSLIVTKILMSYFRRLRKYLMFFEEGRVKEPKTINFTRSR
jgi:hypothetical protein